MTTHHLRWERASRYYEAHLARDLFGDWVLTRVWGRRGTLQGRVVHTPCGSYSKARSLLAKVARRRESRGYRRT